MLAFAKTISSFLVFIILFLIHPLCLMAQENRGNDTAYYIYFPGSITGRLYTSQKYTRFTLRSKNTHGLNYHPNTTFNLGAGATYHNITINLAYGFGFLNPGKRKNKTQYYDLQGHFYRPKWVTDFEGQVYKGYHLSYGLQADDDKNYYRSDMHIALFGISQYYVFNSKRFSFRAAFKQNEWQKKSAGTLLAGSEVYYGVVKADSSLIPQFAQEKYPQKNLTKINYFSIGPGIGYAYTQIIAHYFFLTGALTGNLNFSFATEHLRDNNSVYFSVNLLTRSRLAAGYNSRSWNISANWISDCLPFAGIEPNTGYKFSTGNFRIVIAKRFYPGHRLKKYLKSFDKLFKE